MKGIEDLPGNEEAKEICSAVFRNTLYEDQYRAINAILDRVRSEERERCAKMAFDWMVTDETTGAADYSEAGSRASALAATLRGGRS